MDVRTEPADGPSEAPAAAPTDGGADQGGGDDVVVLSWWQHPVNVVAMVVVALLIGGMVAWLIADRDSARSGGEVDVGFLHDMRAHHEQAVQIGYMYLALPDTDAGLRTVARSIVTGQNIDVGRMVQLLRDLGAPEAAETDTAMAWMGMPTSVDLMPGMASEAQLDEFGATSGAAANEMFVELMTDHHLGGVHMAEAAAADAEDADVRAMAASIASSQADEIRELEQLVD